MKDKEKGNKQIKKETKNKLNVQSSNSITMMNLIKSFFVKDGIKKLKLEIKDKRIMYFIALIISFLMIFVVYVQFKTIEQTDIKTLEVMREVELRSEIANINRRIDEKEKQIEDTNAKISEYLKELKKNTSAPELLKKELEEAQKHLGYTDIKGAGIIITLADSEEENIDSMDILMLVNQLKIANANAISINNERLIFSSEIVTVSGNLIYVNGIKINSPYVIRAIGDSKELEAAVTTRGGTLNEMLASNKSVSHRLSNEVEINKYNRNIDFKYAR